MSFLPHLLLDRLGYVESRQERGACIRWVELEVRRHGEKEEKGRSTLQYDPSKVILTRRYRHNIPLLGLPVDPLFLRDPVWPGIRPGRCVLSDVVQVRVLSMRYAECRWDRTLRPLVSCKRPPANRNNLAGLGV